MANSKRRVVTTIGALSLAAGSLLLSAPGSGAVDDEPTCDGIGALGRINNAPLAVDDEAWTEPGADVEIDVTSNDRDFDGDDLVVIDVLPAGHGLASLEDGVVTYAPGLGFEGFDTFLYVVSDGRCGEHAASVRVQVSETPPPPDEANPEPPVVAVVALTG